MVNETQLKLIETIRQGGSKTRRNCQSKTGNTTKSRCKPNRRGRKLKSQRQEVDRGTGTERRERGRNKQGNTEGTEAATGNLLLVIKFKRKTKTQGHKTYHPNKVDEGIKNSVIKSPEMKVTI